MKEYFGMMTTLAKLKLRKLLKDETGLEGIVIIVVLIGIGVLLAIFFKDQIMGILENLFGTLKETSSGAIKPE